MSEGTYLDPPPTPDWLTEQIEAGNIEYLSGRLVWAGRGEQQQATDDRTALFPEDTTRRAWEDEVLRCAYAAIAADHEGRGVVGAPVLGHDSQIRCLHVSLIGPPLTPWRPGS